MGSSIPIHNLYVFFGNIRVLQSQYTARFSIEVLATDDVRPVVREIAGLKRQFWDYPEPAQIAWFDRYVSDDDLHIVCRGHAGTIVGYVRLAMLTINDRAGCAIDTLCVDREAHGCGLGSAVMACANHVIKSHGFAGFLSCATGLVPFYRRCGWSAAAAAEITSPSPELERLLLHPGEQIMRL